MHFIGKQESRFRFKNSNSGKFLFVRTIHETESQEDDHRSTTSNESSQIKSVSLTKLVIVNEKDKIIFARYNNYIMLPWFTLSNILNELNEEKIKNIVKIFFS